MVFTERNYVTPLGVIQLRIPRTRERSFLPRGIGRLERRGAGGGGVDPAGVFAGDFDAPSGTSGGGVDGRSGQRANRFTADAGAGPGGGTSFTTRRWRTTGLSGSGRRVAEGAAGVWSRSGCCCWWPTEFAAMAGGSCWPLREPRAKARRDGKGCLNDLFQRGLRGRNLQLVITDGCPGLAASHWRRSIRGRGTSAAGCTRCGIFWRKCDGAMKRK